MYNNHTMYECTNSVLCLLHHVCTSAALMSARLPEVDVTCILCVVCLLFQKGSEWLVDCNMPQCTSTWRNVLVVIILSRAWTRGHGSHTHNATQRNALTHIDNNVLPSTSTRCYYQLYHDACELRVRGGMAWIGGCITFVTSIMWVITWRL